MTTEIKVWGEGRKGLWSFNNSVGIPEDYVECEPGDPYVTRHIKLRSEVVYGRRYIDTPDDDLLFVASFTLLDFWCVSIDQTHRNN